MIGPDSAGGPVFSVDGPLVGLTTLLQEETDGDARVGFLLQERGESDQRAFD